MVAFGEHPRWRGPWLPALACGAAVAACGGASGAATATALLVAVSLTGPLVGGRSRWLAVAVAPVLAMVAGAFTGGAGAGLLTALPVAVGLAIWGHGAVGLGGGARPWAALALLLAWLGLDPLALHVHGEAGALLDGLRPGRAVRHLSEGALDLRALLTLAVLPAGAWAWGGLRRADGGDEDGRRNALLRVALAPATVLAVLAALWPHPAQVSLAGGTALDDEETLNRRLGISDGTVIFQVVAGGALTAERREDVRHLRDLLAGVRRLGEAPVAVQWLDPSRSAEAREVARSHGIEAEAGAWAGIAVRNLERTHVLALPARGLQEHALARVLVQLSAGLDVPRLWLLGDGADLAAQIPAVRMATPTDADLRAAIEGGHLGEDGRDEAVLLLGVSQPLSPTRLALLDQYAMAGGSLGFFARDTTEPLRPLLDPWGVTWTSERAPASSAELAEGITLGDRAVQIPGGTPYVDGPEGLLRWPVGDERGGVLAQIQGTVPSGLSDPAVAGLSEARDQSRGTLRALVGSTELLEQNPHLLSDLTAWLLDRPPVPRARPALIPVTGEGWPARMATLLAALLLAGVAWRRQATASTAEGAA